MITTPLIHSIPLGMHRSVEKAKNSTGIPLGMHPKYAKTN